MGAQTILEVKHLTIGFSQKNNQNTVVNDLSFSIEKGEIIGIVGESGSGKSMTALAIMGLLSKEAKILGGEITFLENGNLLKLSERKIRSLKGQALAMIFQEPMTSLNPVMKIGKQIGEMVQLHEKISRQEIYKKTIEIMHEVGLKQPEVLYEKYPHQLSGGMRQRVMIAMAMILKPRLLIADEPTTALDVTIQAQILKLLVKLNQEYNVSVILISHDLGIIKHICSRALVLYSGKLVETDTVHNLFYHPKEDYTKKLLSAVPRREKANQFLESREKKQSVFKQAEVMLSVKKLDVFYQEQKKSIWKGKEKRQVVKDISFDLKKGEILGIVGESGSGKTTLAKAILGLVEEVEGGISTHGHQTRMVFQDPYSSLNPAKMVSWILEEPMKIQGGFTKAERQERVKEMLGKVGLRESYKNRYISQLSGGQRQRISIACALILNPEIIILDEPVSALDVTVQAQILSLLLELRETFDLSYLFISHDLNVIYQMCDRVAVMYQGHIVEMAIGKELYQNPKHEYTKKLLKNTLTL